jgi:hypothetical protein
VGEGGEGGVYASQARPWRVGDMGGERLAGGPDGDDVGDVPTRGGGNDSTICRQGVNDRWAQGARRPRR